jgi:hypothetical protein
MLDVRVLVLLHSNAHKLVNLISNSHCSWRNREGRWDGGDTVLVNASSQASSRFGVLPGFLPLFLHNLLRATGDGFRCFVLLVMGFLISSLMALHCVFCTFKCALLSVVFCMDLRYFLFSSLVPLPGVLPLFI